MILAWTLFSIYLVGTAYLGWLGHKKTDDFGSFAIGRGDLSPLVVGVTLAASTASAATFIINPGFIYVDGLAAFMHLGLATFAGFVTMLILLSFRFRQIGEKAKALTIPDWIGKRYRSQDFSLYFALLNLLSFAFIVLLVGGISIVMQRLLGLTNIAALILTLTFVTGYVFLGGTYAHVFTNMLQGFLMIGISAIIVGSGVYLWITEEPGVWTQIYDKNPDLLKLINPSGELFNDFFSIYIAGFCIGAALVCQPHILTKALYVKTDRAVRNYIIVFAVVFFIFLLLLTTGFFAHVIVPPEQLVDPATGEFRQDLVMTVYLQNAFPDWVFTLISVVLLAAAMSTLDGLLVGLSTITANDLVLTLMEKGSRRDLDQKQKMKIAFNASHVVLVVIAVLTFLVNIEPPRLLGIFGQVGVYGLVLAAIPPLVAGVLFEHVPVRIVWITSGVSLLTHFGLYFFGEQLFPDTTFTWSNPGVTGAFGLIAGLTPTLLICWWINRRARE